MNRTITKDLIVDTFWQLLEEKPYNKITVQDIVNQCKVNRNTFYYHFQDIPFLLESSIENWMDDIIENVSRHGDPTKCITIMAEELVNKKTALLHLYQSAHKDYFLNSLDKISYHVTYTYFNNVLENVSVSEEYKEVFIRFYKCAFVGVLLDWLDNNASYNLIGFFERTIDLLKDPNGLFPVENNLK